MTPTIRYRIRKSNGPKPGFKIEHHADGTYWSSKNHYDTFQEALAAATHCARRNALNTTMDEALLTGEYEGIRADYVHGDTLAAKRRNITVAAKRRNMKIDIAFDCAGPGLNDCHFYIAKVGGQA